MVYQLQWQDIQLQLEEVEQVFLLEEVIVDLFQLLQAQQLLHQQVEVDQELIVVAKLLITQTLKELLVDQAEAEVQDLLLQDHYQMFQQIIKEQEIHLLLVRLKEIQVVEHYTLHLFHRQELLLVVAAVELVRLVVILLN